MFCPHNQTKTYVEATSVVAAYHFFVYPCRGSLKFTSYKVELDRPELERCELEKANNVIFAAK